MKIAGTKNVGAWERMNRFIQKEAATSSGSQTIQDVIQGIESLPAYVVSINDQTAKAGAGGIGDPVSEEGLAAAFAENGVPLQVWMGVQSFATYTRTGSTGNYKYVKDGEKEAREFGGDLRKALTVYKFMKRELQDVADVDSRAAGNPGGLPDLDPSV